MLNIILAGLGGFCGAALRYCAGLIPLLKGGIFPWGTLLINALGSFLIGILAALSAKTGFLTDGAAIFLRVGLCGGFTTFSTFSLEALTLVHTRPWIGLIYMALSVLLCVACAYFALRLFSCDIEKL